MNGAKYIFLFFVFTFISFALYPQEQLPIIKFNYLTINDGLSDNYIEGLFEDKYGYIWIGTWDGLNKYDGYAFKVYKNDPFDTNSIKSNFVWDIYQDSQDNLWIGTNLGGIALYNYEKDNFHTFYFDNDNRINNNSKCINEIVETDDFVWFATLNGLARYDLNKKTFFWYFHVDSNDYSLASNNVYSMMPSKGNNLWIGTSNFGLLYFDYEGDCFKKLIYNNDDNSVNNNVIIKEIYRCNHNKIWIATDFFGLMLYDSTSNTYSTYQYNPYDSNSIGSNYIISIYEDSKDNLWVGAINGGLNLYNRNKNNFFRYGYNKFDDRVINSESVSNLIEDSYGNIWVGTHGGGVSIINPYLNQFSHIRKELSLKSLPYDYVSCFYEDDNGNIWIGTDGGGFCRMIKNTMDFKSFNKNNGLLSDAVLDIERADSNHLWIATWSGGLSLFDIKNEKIVKTFLSKEKSNSITSNNIKSLYNDGKYLWIATHGNGLNVYDIADEKFYNSHNNTVFKGLNMPLPQWGNVVYKDRKSRIWIGSMSGLFLYTNDTTYTFYYIEGDTTSLNGYTISCVFEDKQNNIWIGTENGLNLFIDELTIFKRINQSKLMVRIRSIEEDNTGNFWISTNSGIFKYNYKINTILQYTVYDGLQANQFIDRSSNKGKDGTLYFGGINGFNFFNPDNLMYNTVPPKVYIVDLKILGKSQIPGKPGSVLNKHISFTDTIVINYKQNVITFEYTGINLVVPERINYKYILEGFDNEWQNANAERKVTYTNLNPGEYTFKVKAANNEYIWSKEPASVVLIVNPPWWMTPWFTISIIALLIIISLSFYFIRINRIKAINKMLEKQVAIRTNELENANEELLNKNEQINYQNIQLIQQKEEIETQKDNISKQNKSLENKNKELNELNKTKDKFFSIIAHDLKNPLSSIIGFSELLHQRIDNISREKLEKYVEIIFSSAKNLYSLLENLLNWARSQTGSVNYSPEIILASRLINENYILLKSVANKKNIQLKVNIKNDSHIYVDENMINTVLRNLITNAIKFTSSGGEITILAEKHEKMIEISIIDNGVGVSPDKINKLFKLDEGVSTSGTEMETGTGLGLIIAKEFVEKNKGKIIVKSQPGMGSVFSVFLPIKNNSL